MRRRDLYALFARERARFVRTFPAVARAHLALVDRPHPTPGPGAWRDFAQVDLETGEITLTRRVLRLPLANVRGLIRHELGHLAAPEGSEVDADRAAWRATGVRIRYDARALQTTGRGGPRPRDMHR